jgi:DNA-binding IclR family transcriptional regulator
MRGVRHMIDLLDWFADHGVAQAPVARLIDDLGIARSSFYDLMSVFEGSAILGPAGRGTVGRGPLALDAGLAATGLGRDWAALERSVAALAADLGRPVRLWVPDGADALLILDAGVRSGEAGRRRPLLATPAGWLLAAALPERRRRFLDPGDPARRQAVAGTVARLAAALAAGGNIEVLSEPQGRVAVRALRDADAIVRGALAVDLGAEGEARAVAALERWHVPR